MSRLMMKVLGPIDLVSTPHYDEREEEEDRDILTNAGNGTYFFCSG